MPLCRHMTSLMVLKVSQMQRPLKDPLSLNVRDVKRKFNENLRIRNECFIAFLVISSDIKDWNGSVATMLPFQPKLERVGKEQWKKKRHERSRDGKRNLIYISTKTRINEKKNLRNISDIETEYCDEIWSLHNPDKIELAEKCFCRSVYQ